MIPGFVLAGGRSSRMGRDKALLPLEGEPLALRVAAVLRAAGCAPVALVGRQTALWELGLPVVAEPETGDRHPLLGLAAALASLPGGLCLVCPCDLVGLRPEHVRALLARGGPCVARTGGRIHPLLAVLDAAEAPRAAALASSGAGAHALTGGLEPVDLPPEALHDANRPEDLPDGAALR